MTDFNPNKFEQPDHAKQEIQSVRDGLGMFLIATHTLAQSVQLFSRVPGTSGPLFVVAQLFCIVGQFLFYEARVDAGGQADVIGIGIWFYIQLIWFVYGFIATFIWRARGLEVDIIELGIPVLCRRFPKANYATVAFCSDMLVAGLLTAVFYLTGSPILGDWYCVTAFVLLINHKWMYWREQTEKRRFMDAQKRARQWSRRLKELNRR